MKKMPMTLEIILLTFVSAIIIWNFAKSVNNIYQKIRLMSNTPIDRIVDQSASMKEPVMSGELFELFDKVSKKHSLDSYGKVTSVGSGADVDGTEGFVVFVDFSRANTSEVDLDELANQRANGIADEFIKDQRFDQYWKIILIRCNDIGAFKFRKENIVEGENGRYFNMAGVEFEEWTEDMQRWPPK